MAETHGLQIGSMQGAAANERVVGIDLGTTNSLVAFMQGETPVVIPGEDGSPLVPSVVAIPASGEPLVGNAARAILVKEPARAIYSAKRLMGRGAADVQDELKYFPFQIEGEGENAAIRVKVGGKPFTPPEISALVLRQLKRNAERFFATPVNKAVITVPAYFNDAQRQATKDAGRIAGLDVLRLVNEPTAAALAYGLDRRREGTIAVYDLGGGTFDISILKLHEGIFEVVATNGDTHLGGDDIDNLLIATAITDIAGEMKLDVTSGADAGAAIQAIRQAVIDAKIALSTADKTVIDAALPNGTRYQREITREIFEAVIEPIVQKTLAPVRAALADAGLEPQDIDEVVLVGGSTRIPRVRQAVAQLFGREPHAGLNPDEVVALGAAVQADILTGSGRSAATKDMLLLDVTPLSLGIESLGGAVAKIIHRNSTIPASATESFTTGVEGQTNVAIHVLQGERELARDCRSLARFDLKNIPPMPAGLPRIEVRFLIDANGILNVTARELRSGREAEVEVKPTYGLTDEQVEAMILDSFDNAEQDFRDRQLVESRNEAQNILDALARGKKNTAWLQLGEAEKAEIAALELDLEKTRHADDYKALQASVEALNKATTRLAELMMETAVSTALHGKTMESASDEMGEGPAAPHPIAPAEITQD